MDTGNVEQAVAEGFEHQQAGRLEPAKALYEKVLAEAPEHPQAMHLLGVIEHKLGRHQRGLELVHRSVQLAPGSPDFHNNFGALLAEQGRTSDALKAFANATRLRPNFGDALNNLGSALAKSGDYAQAANAHRKAIELEPENVGAYNNLFHALLCQGRLAEAISAVRDAVERQPQSPEANWNLALGLLCDGQFEEGWRLYEWRWKLKGFQTWPNPRNKPMWDGSPLDGRTILIHCEQGLGTNIQFSRYIPLLAARGGRVILECPHKMVPLFTTLPGVEQVIGANPKSAPQYDVHAAMVSLPHLCGTSLKTVPAQVPYLFPDEQKTACWMKELARDTSFKVGITWQGNPQYKGDLDRSIPLDLFLPLAHIEGVQLFSLQKGKGYEQLEKRKGSLNIKDMGKILDNKHGAFMDTAALMKSLDLVITSDTSTAHLAGALGVPVWVALGHAPDWRWMLQREDCPWYPTMKLFRQERRGDWASLFQRIGHELRLQSQKPREQKPLSDAPALFSTSAIAGALELEPPQVSKAPKGRQLPLAPPSLDQLVRLGLDHLNHNRFDDAQTAFAHVLHQVPHHPGALHLSGVTAHRKGDNDLAERLILRSIELAPDMPDFHNNLGNVYATTGRTKEAIASFEKALAFAPEHPQALGNLGAAYEKQGRLAESVELQKRSIALRPKDPDGHVNLGHALRKLGRYQEALDSYRRALQLNPDSAPAHNGVGVVFQDLGELKKAFGAFQYALKLQPHFPDALQNTAVNLLASGDFERGWKAFEGRRHWKGIDRRSLPAPVWKGEEIKGKTILLRCEQGLGDTFHFIRYAPMLKALGAKVIVDCPTVLQKILTGVAGIDQLVTAGDPVPQCDVAALLMDMPHLFGTTLDTVPADVPYLKADTKLTEQWKEELQPIEGLKVGIAWWANDQHNGGVFRRIPLQEFEPLAKVPNVRLMSLQKGEGEEQIDANRGRFRVETLGKDFDTTSGAFMDTAAVMMSLDLVITTDTSIAHLAGALGVPVWVAIPQGPDFRWMLSRSDSPWYPTMRLFRQKQRGDWKPVFQDLAVALRERVGLPSLVGPLKADIAPGELLDKISILQIKSDRITDAAKLQNVNHELRTLIDVRNKAIRWSTALDALTHQLAAVNQKLWEVEDAIRACEARQTFDQAFIDLARSVYLNNDERARIKRSINELLGSKIVEEKAYAAKG